MKLDLKTPSPLLLSSSWAQLHSRFSASSPVSSTGGWGMGAVISSSHFVSAAPFSSGTGLLILFPCSSVRSRSQETVLHKLLQRESFPWAATLHKRPQCGSLPMGLQSFRNRLLQRGSPMGSQVLPENLLWQGLLSPLVHRSWQEPASAQGSSPGHRLLCPSACSCVVSLPWTTGSYLLHSGPP